MWRIVLGKENTDGRKTSKKKIKGAWMIAKIVVNAFLSHMPCKWNDRFFYKSPLRVFFPNAKQEGECETHN